MKIQDIRPLVLAALFAGALFAMDASLPVTAGDQPAAVPAKDKEDKAELFSGKIEERNAEQKWLKIDKQTYYVTDKTKLLNNDKEIKFEDLVVGTEVNGLAKKNAEGKLEASIVKVGLKPNESPAEPRR